MSATPVIPLTPRQHQALTLIQSRPVAPTFGEIGEALDISRGTACNLVSRLVRAGYVTRGPGHHRNLCVVRMAPARIELTRDEGLAYARAWRLRTKPHFDALYGREG